MTTLLVNINDEREERALLAFLNTLKFTRRSDGTLLDFDCVFSTDHTSRWDVGI